jgi:hypothetical protein
MTHDTDDGEDASKIDVERTREEKLRALVRKDIHPNITELAEEALRRRQEGNNRRDNR